MDRSADPGEDFFRYAVGKWIKDHPIPSTERSWGSGNVVREETYQRVLKINESAAKHPAAAKGSVAQKIGDFWHSAMDTATIEKQGIAPLKQEFDRISAIQNQKDLMDVVARLQYIGTGVLYANYIFQDEKDSTRYALHLYQGGIGLPDRDYSFDEDERAKRIRSEYGKHLTKMFELLGDPQVDAEKNAATVIRIETDLARASRKLQDLRDPQTNYNKMKVEELSTLAPSIEWKTFFSKGHIEGIDTVIVGQPEFFKQVEQSTGRQFDEKGNLRQWWTKEDEQEFNKRAKKSSNNTTSTLR